MDPFLFSTVRPGCKVHSFVQRKLTLHAGRSYIRVMTQYNRFRFGPSKVDLPSEMICGPYKRTELNSKGKKWRQEVDPLLGIAADKNKCQKPRLKYSIYRMRVKRIDTKRGQLRRDVLLSVSLSDRARVHLSHASLRTSFPPMQRLCERVFQKVPPSHFRVSSCDGLRVLIRDSSICFLRQVHEVTGFGDVP